MGFLTGLKAVWAGAAMIGACVAQPVLCAPVLENTSLYKEIAHACRTLDLKYWSHPTKRVLYGLHIKINKVELCNNDVYPIFTVSLPGDYEATSVNDSYYNKLFIRMFEANGYHPFSFVDMMRGLVINIAASDRKELDPSIEDFEPSR